MINLKKRSFSTLILLLFLFGCKYNESDAIRSNNISERVVNLIDYKKTISYQKKILYIEYFNQKGNITKKVYYQNKKTFRIFEYDSLDRLIYEYPYFQNRPNNLFFKTEYLYDKYGNFLYTTRHNHLLKNKIYYNDDNKLKILMIYKPDGNYKRIIAYYYNWLGYMNKKIQLNFSGKKIGKVRKFEYKYSFWGKLLQEKIFSCYVNRKPVFENGNLLVNRYRKNYKLRVTHKYTYYGNGLLKAKEKYANEGYIEEKINYEYKGSTSKID